MSKKVIIAIAIGILAIIAAFVMLIIDHKQQIDDLENIETTASIKKVVPQTETKTETKTGTTPEVVGNDKISV